MTGPGLIPDGLPWSWGATAAERAAPMPCAALVAGSAVRAIRAVEVEAPAAVAFRWVCAGAPFLLIFRIVGWLDGRETASRGLTQPELRAEPDLRFDRESGSGPASVAR